MTIRIKGTQVVAQNTGNRKAVFCITDLKEFDSLSEAAQAYGVAKSTISWVITNRMKTCKGKRFCLVSEMPYYAEEIAEASREIRQKAVQYDTMIARQKAVEDAHNKYKKAQETVRAREESFKALQLKCMAEEAKLRDAKRALEKAEAEVKKLQN